MSERVTAVRLSLQAQQYMAGMRQAAEATAAVGKQAERLAAQREAFNLLGRTLLVAGGLMAAGAGIAIARFMEFDQAMSQVQAATQETAENMDLLREAALKAGGETVYTATEAANAIEELGKNGLTTAQILSGGLDAALGLAAAGGLDVARAAEIAAITMKQFNLEGAQLPHVSDLMAAGAGKAAGDVEDLANALSQSGLVAAQTGLSIEETTGTLAAFADNALLGSDAGTSLRTMLLRLTPTSGEAAKEMKRLGIDAYDASGQFIGMAQFAGQLKDRLGGLTNEQRNTSLSIIFGQDAIRGATLLYDQGAEGIQRYIDQTNDAGYAARVAADRLDNLAGDVEKLGGAWDTALIQTGTGANDVLRTMVQSATFLVDAFGGLPEPVINVGLALGVTAAAIALTGGAAVTAIPKIAEYRTMMSTLNISARTTAIGIAGVGLALSAGIIIFSLWASKQAEAKVRADTFRDSLNQATGALTDYSRALIAKQLEEDGAFEVATRLGISQKEVTAAIFEGGDALTELQAKLQAFKDRQGELTPENNIFNQLFGQTPEESANDAASLGASIDAVSSAIDDGRESWRNQVSATRDGTRAADQAADALAGVGGAARGAGDDVDALAAQIRGFGSATLDTRAANRQFQAAVDDLTASIKENGSTLNVNTEEGRANQQAVDDVARSTLELAAAKYEQTGSEEAARDAIQDGREALLKQLEAFGITGDKAQTYVDRLGLIPDNITTAVELQVGEAEARFNRFLEAYTNRRIPISAVVRMADYPNADGNLYTYARAFNSGGVAEGVYRGGPPLYKFAEPETRWEAFISGRPGKEKENIGYALEALHRLGGPSYAQSSVPAAPQVTVVVQPRGGINLLEYVDIRVERSDQAKYLDTKMGRI